MDVPGDRMDVQSRPGAVRIALSIGLTRPHAFLGARNRQSGKVAGNAAALGHFHRGADGYAKVLRHVNNNVARGSFQARISERVSGGSQVGNDGSGPGLRAQATASLANVYVAAAGLHLVRSADVVQA